MGKVVEDGQAPDVTTFDKVGHLHQPDADITEVEL
jgi:hypothetical protein